MSFAHPIVLTAVALPALWVWLAWRYTARPITLVLKALAIATIIAALSQPQLILPQAHSAVLVLADTSDSLSESDLSRASALVRQMQQSRGGNSISVVPFAASPRPLSANEIGKEFRLEHSASNSASSTSLESALTAAMFSLPENRVPRVALVSDGNENEGSSARALIEMRRLRIPIDTFPIGERNAAGFYLDSASLPDHAYAGEQIPVNLVIHSPKESDARIDLSAETKNLGSNTVHLKPGKNDVRIHTRINSSGAALVSGRITSQGLGELSFRECVSLRRAKVLYVSQDPAGSDGNLLSAFGQADFDVTRDVSKLAGDLARFQLVVLNNFDLTLLPLPIKARLESYVKDGGGLLLIGGERQRYKQDKQMDVLDRALPADLAPPKSPEGTCVVLIMDKSSSMEGRKIELARLSAVGVVDHLRPIDTIGVLIFDNSYQWAVPIRKAEDKTLIKRLISGITPDGGTQIAPALTEAYKRVLSSHATFKHIVLLTDGISEEGDSIDLAHEAINHGITISTVGLGQDVNRTYLEKVALSSGGKSYFLNDPAGLEQILLKDVKDYSGTTVVERPLTPLIVHNVEILNGTNMAAAPALKGYARFTAKPTADTILEIDPERKDPLYVRWPYGLGRAGIFTSDAKSRWAEAWITWAGFDAFWINTARDLLTHTNRNEAGIRFEPSSNQLAVTYRPESTVSGSPPSLFALGPKGFSRPVQLRYQSPGVLTGSVDIGNTRGLFRVRPATENDQFPELGFYRGEEELQQHGANTSLLQRIATTTGGRYNPPPAAVFDNGGRSLYSTLHLWPLLLGIAIALIVTELISRKWRVLVERFSS